MAPGSHGHVLDATHGFAKTGKYQDKIVLQCARFIDSESSYTEEEASVLLQVPTLHFTSTPCAIL